MDRAAGHQMRPPCRPPCIGMRIGMLGGSLPVCLECAYARATPTIGMWTGIIGMHTWNSMHTINAIHAIPYMSIILSSLAILKP